MSHIEEISKMNLADLESPYGDNDPVETTESLDENGSDSPENLPAESGQEETDDENDGNNEVVKQDTPKAETSPEKMAEPTGTHYYIDARIGKEELAPFVRAHLIKNPTMVIFVLIGLGLTIYSLLSDRGSVWISLIYFAGIVIAYPLFQYNNVMKMNLANPIYKDVLHYMIDEWGFHLEADNRALDVEWKHFIQRKKYGPCYVLYTGKANAYLLPAKAMGDKEEEIIRFIDSHLGGA